MWDKVQVCFLPMQHCDLCAWYGLGFGTARWASRDCHPLQGNRREPSSKWSIRDSCVLRTETRGEEVLWPGDHASLGPPSAIKRALESIRAMGTHQGIQLGPCHRLCCSRTGKRELSTVILDFWTEHQIVGESDELTTGPWSGQPFPNSCLHPPPPQAKCAVSYHDISEQLSTLVPCGLEASCGFVHIPKDGSKCWLNLSDPATVLKKPERWLCFLFPFPSSFLKFCWL